ncbi:MAG: hypothetical protein RR766_02500, partial [Longicatena sp.]
MMTLLIKKFIKQYEQIDNEEMKSKKSQIENILKNLSTSELICELLENKEIFFSTDNTPLE